jgi:hypothetical protein
LKTEKLGQVTLLFVLARILFARIFKICIDKMRMIHYIMNRRMIYADETKRDGANDPCRWLDV